MDTSVFGQVDGLVSINSVSLLHSTMLNWPQDVQLVWANTKMCVGGAPLGPLPGAGCSRCSYYKKG